MKNRIDPMIDCVAKAILGDAEHTDRTIDFLQAVLQCDPPIEDVAIANPFSFQEFSGDNYIVVDVRVRDRAGNTVVVEIQVHTPPDLPARILYGWADTYHYQAQAGQPFSKLKPVVTIWLLGRTLFRNSKHWHHTFKVCDPDKGVLLTEHFAIHTLELTKWKLSSDVPLGA